MRPQRESAIERYFTQQVAKLPGVECRKVKWIGRNHAPDRVVMGGGCTWWVELKRSPKSPPRPGQAREHERMRSAGQTVFVIGCPEDVDAFVTLVEMFL